MNRDIPSKNYIIPLVVDRTMKSISDLIHHRRPHTSQHMLINTERTLRNIKKHVIFLTRLVGKKSIRAKTLLSTIIAPYLVA